MSSASFGLEDTPSDEQTQEAEHLEQLSLDEFQKHYLLKRVVTLRATILAQKNEIAQLTSRLAELQTHTTEVAEPE